MPTCSKAENRFFFYSIYIFNPPSSYVLVVISLLRSHLTQSVGRCPRGVMVKAVDCRIVVSEFEFQSHFYVHFRDKYPLSSRLWVKLYHYCYSVIFWPSTRPKNAIPRWCTGRKWHIPMASNRKRSRGRIKAYNMGQGECLTVPNRLMHRKRVTSELHDSYFRLMTIKHSISKIQWAIVRALNYYLTQLSSSPRSSCQ